MKKSDVEYIITTLKELKRYTDRLDFNTTIEVNKKIMSILPIVEQEYIRLDEDKIEFTAPKLMVIGTDDIKNSEKDLTSYVNDVLSKLVSTGNKVVDYGLVNDGNAGSLYVYIKYTE